MKDVTSCNLLCPFVDTKKTGGHKLIDAESEWIFARMQLQQLLGKIF